MRKILAVLTLVLAMTGIACADVKIDLDRYECQICHETFFVFKGDPIEKLSLLDQSKKVYRLADKSKHLKPCKDNLPAHSLKKIGTSNVTPYFISANIDKIAVIDGGGSLNQKLVKWKCLLCDKTFYSLGGYNLNIKDWDLQPDRIISFKGGRGIPKCSKISDGYFGHVFKITEEGSMTSYKFADSSILDNVYYVK